MSTESATTKPTLNLSKESIIPAATQDTAKVPHRKVVNPKVGLMIDIETLALGTRPVVTQFAMYGFLIDNPEELLDRPVMYYLPVQPQLELLPPRVISALTIGWWMKQDDDARAKFSESLDGDIDELRAWLRQAGREFDRMTRGLSKGEYEVWARGPQFDVASMESLMAECGVEVPWAYDSVRDLRTLMSSAGITSDDVPKLEGQITHHAGWDCLYQIRCYMEANRQMRSR